MLGFNEKKILEVYRFIIVGLCSVTIDFLFYYLLIYFDLLDLNNSKRLSFILGAIFAFYANRNFVFKIKKRKNSQYIMFSFLYFTSFVLNSVVHDYIYLISQLTLISFLGATFISTITNYTGQKFIIFKNDK